MDALLAAAVDAAAREGAGTVPRIVIVPTAAARQRPELAASHGERAFAAAASRARVTVEIGVAGILTRGDAGGPAHRASRWRPRTSSTCRAAIRT